ncbi:MAG: hypothetical protein Kow0099_24000 [Candidatus Abyssubacteria bacterium]
MSRRKKKGRDAPHSGSSSREERRDAVYEWADNLVFAGVILVLFFRPFLSGRTYPHYNHFFHIFVVLVAVLWIVKCWRRRVLELHNRLVTGFALAFVGVCALTFFTTVDKGLTLRYIYEITSYTLLFLIIANNFREETSVKIAVGTILAAGFLANLYGLYQNYRTLDLTRQVIQEALQSRDPQMLPGIPIDTGVLHRLESTRIFSTFLHPNSYALFLAMTGALTVGWIWSMYAALKRFAGASLGRLKSSLGIGNSSNLKSTTETVVEVITGCGGLLLLVILAVSCVLIPWNLWLTQSRGGLLSAIVIAVVFASVGIVNRRTAAGKVAVFAGALFVIFLALGPADAVPVDTLSVRETSFFSRLRDTLTVTQRFTYWKATLDMIQDNPWFGVGWGAFEKAYPKYMIQGGYPTRLAHNNYLQVWAETGILGLNAFIGLWIVFFYTFWRKWRGTSPEMRGIVCGLAAAIIGFLVNSLADFALYSPTLAYIIFGALGLLVAIPSDREDKFTIAFSGTFAAIMIGCACVLLVALGRSFGAAYLCAQSDKIRNSAFPNQFVLARGFETDPETQLQALNKSVELLKRSTRYFPLDSDAHRLLGDSYLRLAFMTKSASFLDGAIAELRRAAQLSPLSPYVYHSLATAYWAVGNATGKPDYFEMTIEAERQASANFPVNPEFHEQLAQIYASLNLEEQAKHETSVAEELRKHYREF